MSKNLTTAYKNIDASKRARAIKQLTDNGRKKKAVRDLHRLMSDRETLLILNALFEVCNE